MPRSIQRAITLAGLLFIAGAAPLWADLDATQKQVLATADNGLKQLEVNLKLAEGAAGPGSAAIQGSKARLVQSRLAMAKAPVAQLTELVAKLPAADPQVAALKKRLVNVSASIEVIEGRLAGKPAEPAPAAPGPVGGKPKNATEKNAPAPVAGEVRLDYKQEQLAKDARSYLAEVDGLTGGAADVVKEITPVKDRQTIDHRRVQAAANAIAKGRQRAGLVKGRLDQLPANGKGVAELVTQYNEQIAALDASDKVIAPLHKELSALVNPASYPDLEADIKRIQQLALMYQGSDVLTRNYERAAVLVGQAPAADAEVKRITLACAPLIHQKTAEGERLEKMSQFYQENFADFSAAAAKQKQALPGEIEADLAKSRQLADQAVAEQKPAFFSGGIPVAVAIAENKIILLRTLDPARADTMQAKVTAARQHLKARESSLKDAIIAANELPPNRYAGQDKANLEHLAVAVWKKSDPAAEVLAIRFPSEQWDRETLLRWENRTWRPIDRSNLQAQLLVKQDDKRAVIRPINLWIDHLNNHQLTAIPMDDAKDELPPQRILLIERIK